MYKMMKMVNLVLDKINGNQELEKLLHDSFDPENESRIPNTKALETLVNFTYRQLEALKLK